MKLTTKQLKKYIKENGVTKARISEDYRRIGSGLLFDFGLTDSGRLYGNNHHTGIIYLDKYKGTFEVVEETLAYTTQREIDRMQFPVTDEYRDKRKKAVERYFAKKHEIDRMEKEDELYSKSLADLFEELKDIIQLKLEILEDTDDKQWQKDNFAEDIKTYIKQNFIPKTNIDTEELPRLCTKHGKTIHEHNGMRFGCSDCWAEKMMKDPKQSIDELNKLDFLLK